MSEVTAPIMTDATGQSIDSKLNSLLGKMDNLAEAFQPNASGIVYSNTTSGLTGDDVQEAIDEVAGDITEINTNLTNLLTTLFKTSQTLTNQDFDNLPLGLVYNSGTCAHSPISGAVYMLVITICIDSSSAPRGQFAIDFNGTNANSDIYFRNQTAGTWRTWKKLNNS